MQLNVVKSFDQKMEFETYHIENNSKSTQFSSIIADLKKMLQALQVFAKFFLVWPAPMQALVVTVSHRDDCFSIFTNSFVVVVVGWNLAKNNLRVLQPVLSTQKDPDDKI